MYICMYVCMYIYIYIYIYDHNQKLRPKRDIFKVTHKNEMSFLNSNFEVTYSHHV